MRLIGLLIAVSAFAQTDATQWRGIPYGCDIKWGVALVVDLFDDVNPRWENAGVLVVSDSFAGSPCTYKFVFGDDEQKSFGAVEVSFAPEDAVFLKPFALEKLLVEKYGEDSSETWNESGMTTTFWRNDPGAPELLQGTFGKKLLYLHGETAEKWNRPKDRPAQSDY